MKTLRLLFIACACALMALPCHAVLKEKNLESTLLILRAELTGYYLELEEQNEHTLEQQRAIGQNLMDIYNRSTQNSLMLYSQKKDYIFNLTYACHEATEMYAQFRSQSLPFRQMIESNSTDIARYDSLIINLEHMPQMNLSDEARTNRNVCLTLANHIRSQLKENSDQMVDYINYYQRTEEKLRALNDYALRCYEDIQSSIFVNGGDNYFTILKNLGKSYHSMTTAMEEQYSASSNSEVQSQWDPKMIFMLFGILIVYGLLSVMLNFFVVRLFIRKHLRHREAFREKQTYILITTSVVTLALILGVVLFVLSDQNFLIMASQLLVQYTWLLSVILISLLLRMTGKQIRSAIRIYAPLIVMGLLVISFRIVLIPNDMVNLLFPPILLVCAIWQWIVIARNAKDLPRSDTYYAYISLAVFLASVACSWAGYTLFSVQMLIWWIMQLTCILTITCISGWMSGWAKRKHFDKKPITQTWFYDFCNTVVLRVLAIASVVIAIYWAADVFNMSDTTWHIFMLRFIDTDSFSASIYSICLVCALFFVFDYINRTVKDLLAMHFEKSDHSTAASKNVLAKNLVQIIVWGAWLLLSLGLFRVGNSWLLVISGGLSTGIGFASKDILENIYYGVSLMTGRVKIGDLIECDGYRGTVSSISYTSTMLNIADGSVIAFQNSQLFTKNYKNLTKNHGYELDKYEVGVAYGTDVKRVRELLVKNISALPFIRKNSTVTVSIADFGDSSVNLKISAWVPVKTYMACGNEIREVIYNTLNENNIEIPFPQLDVHQK